MNRQIALLAFVTVTLVACTAPPRMQGSPAPVIDLASGPSGKPAKASAPKADTNAPSPAPATSNAQQTKGAYLEGDGPDGNVPPNLDDIPDAVPKAEPFHRYANRPYTALGKTYTPLETTGNYKEVGIASWYGKKFNGQRTSIGDLYDMYAMTASHPTLPIPSYARITNVATKKSVIVRINDRGPFLHDRIIDLSYTAAYKLGIINNGVAEVQVESIAVESGEPATVSTVLTSPVKSMPLPVVTPASAPAATPVVAPTIAAASAPLAKPAQATGNVYLQLGIFKTTESANKFLTQMNSKLSAENKTLSVAPKNNLQQVVMGPYTSSDEAAATKKRLKAKLGINSYINVR